MFFISKIFVSEAILNSVETFLDLYRTLEEDLKEFYAGKRLKYSNPVYEFMNTDGRRYYDEIDLCREIRNILSHHPYFEGEMPIIPSDNLIDALREIIHYVENPVTAIKLSTGIDDLVTATFEDGVPSVLTKMEKRGFSHVPVTGSGGLLEGVFSVGAVFEFVKSRPGIVIDNSVLLSDMKDFLPVNVHRSEQYLFCTPDATLSEVKNMFRSSGPKQRRVAAVFVTKTADRRSPLRGMITPWDIIKDAHNS